jgi:hypothetical protein
MVETIEEYEKPTAKGTPPLSTYTALGKPYGNFWVRYGYLIQMMTKTLISIIIIDVIVTVIGLWLTANLIGGLLFYIRFTLIAFPILFFFLLWLLGFSYIFREKAYLFPDGHPYQEKKVYNLALGQLSYQLGPSRHSTKMDVEITQTIRRNMRGKKGELLLFYPLNYYGKRKLFNLVNIPIPEDLQEGDLLRIYRFGFRFDDDYSDVYLRMHFASNLRMYGTMGLWLIVFIAISISYTWLIFWIL